MRRALTSAERALASSVFGTAIDYDAVTINDRKWWWFQPKNITMAPDGHIWFHPKGGLYCDNFCDADMSAQGLFIHEMTHIYQAQRGGRWFLPLMRHPFCRYDYSIIPDKPFGHYGIEQQAEIIRHVFMLRNGIKVPGKPGLDIYEALLPF